VQAIINMGVNMGLLRPRPDPAPAVIRGSGIAANCTAIGVLMRVDWENRQVMKGYSV